MTAGPDGMLPGTDGTGLGSERPASAPEFLPPGQPAAPRPGEPRYGSASYPPAPSPFPPGQPPYGHPAFPPAPPFPPGQPPYGQGQAPYGPPQPVMLPGPYAAPSAPPPPTDGDEASERVPLRYGVAAIVATLVLAVVAVAVTVWASSPRPAVPAASVWTAAPSTVPPTRVATTPRATPSLIPGNCSGTRAGTPGWTSTVPTGWSCAYQPGAELRIDDGHGAVIQVEATTGTPLSACTTRLSALGTAARLADTRWGGRAATTTSLTSNGWTYVLRCTTSNTYTYVMTGAVLGGSVDALVAAQEALAQSWVWKA